MIVLTDGCIAICVILEVDFEHRAGKRKVKYDSTTTCLDGSCR